MRHQHDNDHLAMLAEFMTAMGQPVSQGWEDLEGIRLGLKLIEEETEEFRSKAADRNRHRRQGAKAGGIRPALTPDCIVPTVPKLGRLSWKTWPLARPSESKPLGVGVRLAPCLQSPSSPEAMNNTFSNEKGGCVIESG